MIGGITFLFCVWTSLLGNVHSFLDWNYRTETPSPPTLLTMAGPTHVLVHINPDIHKDYAAKIVDYYDKENLTDFTAFCRCWRSKHFPYCDGFHNKYNELITDNVGPIIVRRRNVSCGARFVKRLRKMSINESFAGTPTMCTRTSPKATTTKRRRSTEPDIDVDAYMDQYGKELFNFTNYLDEFANIEQKITSYVPPTEDTRPTTEPEPTLWLPSYRAKRKRRYYEKMSS